MKVNINDIVKVKLTDHGRDIYYHRFDKITGKYQKEVIKPSYPKTDKEGVYFFSAMGFNAYFW